MANGELYYVDAPVRAARPLWDGTAHGERGHVVRVDNREESLVCAFGGRLTQFYGLDDVEIDQSRLVFPIPAAKDPWRESEQGHARDGIDHCKSVDPEDKFLCCRARGHMGHCLHRYVEGGKLNARWLAAPRAPVAEKRLPRKGDKVVLAGEIVNCLAKVGDVGKVEFVGEHGFRVRFNCSILDDYLPVKEFGATVVLAAEWEKREQKPTGPVVGMEVVAVRPPYADSLVKRGDRGLLDWLADNGDFHCVLSGVGLACAARDFGDLIVPAVEWDARQPSLSDDACSEPTKRRGVFKIDPSGDPLVSVERMARALFELDMDEHCCRVADEGKGGIGKAKAFDIMWSNVSDETRDLYMWRAAFALKRATELP